MPNVPCQPYPPVPATRDAVLAEMSRCALTVYLHRDTPDSPEAVEAESRERFLESVLQLYPTTET